MLSNDQIINGRRVGVSKGTSTPEDLAIKTKVLNDALGVMNIRKVGVSFVKADEKPVLLHEPGSMALNDPTGETADGSGVIDPPYDPLTFSSFRENNNAITPMVGAYKTNIAGFGYKLKYSIDLNSQDVDESIRVKAKEEWVKLDNFYKFCNFDQSFTEIVQKMIDDKEYIGFGVIEILQNTKGQPAGFEYIPAHTIKIAKLHPTPQAVKLQSVDVLGKVTKIAFQKKFRRFKQEVDNQIVWFREFGDPRKMDRITGTFEGEIGNDGSAAVVLPENEASALIMFSNFVPYTVYGQPNWLGNILGMQGSRRSEELNYRYFQKGRHTPLAILVNNGSLTESSMDVLKGYVNNVEGVENAFGYLVLEATGYEDEADPSSSETSKTNIEIKPLLDALQTDGLFQVYDQSNRDKLRESMRLAPIYTGASKDYTRATADVAKAITEEQVFQPERTKITDKINRLVNQALDIKYVEMVLNGPDITNKKDLADTVSVYAKTGAITANMVNQSVSNLLGQEFEQVEDAWANLPINLVVELIKQGKLEIKLLRDGTTNTTTGTPTNPDKPAKPTEPDTTEPAPTEPAAPAPAAE